MTDNPTPGVLTIAQSTDLDIINPQALIERALDHGASVDTMERLFALAKEIRALKAQEAYNVAIAEFQRQCPPIKKSARATIANKYSYTYAPLEEITATVGPLMGRCGLSRSWRTRPEGEKIIVVCRISHALGHYEESGEVMIPISQGAAEGMGATPPQRVGIAMSYGKRYSLLSALGLAPEDDTDAKDTTWTDGGRGTNQAANIQGSGQTGHGQELEAVINENQIKRLMAIAGGQKWSEEHIHELISGFGYNSRKEIQVKDYEKIIERLKGGPTKAGT